MFFSIGGTFDYVAARWLMQNGLLSRADLATFPKKNDPAAGLLGNTTTAKNAPEAK